MVVADLAVVDEVRPRILATCLEGFPEYFPSLLVATFNEGSFASHHVADVLGGVVVIIVFGSNDVMLGVVRVVDEPSHPRVVVVNVFFVQALFVGQELDGACIRSLPFAL